MCKVRDIIVIDEYEHEGKMLSKHSFVIIDDEADEIQGLPYDFVANVMSSFKNNEQKARKLKYPGNFPIGLDDRITDPDNGKEGYIKAEQFYYFKKDTIDFSVIGEINKDKFDELIKFMQELDDFEEILDNIKEQED